MSRWNKILLAAATFTLTAGVAQAGPIYSYSWNAGDAGEVSNSGGVINWVESQFDTNTNRLTWYTNIGNGTRLKADGFTLALSAGGTDAAEGETAMLYFDGKTPTVQDGLRPALTAYRYNGDTVGQSAGWTSYLDAESQAGIQAPEQIASSFDTSTNWIYDLTCEANADGSRTMGFEIDVTPLINHASQYAAPSGEPWNPAPFAETLGVWMGTYSSMSTDYTDDYLNQWGFGREGWLKTNALASVDNGNGDGPPTDPVPEPATITLLGLGAAGLLRARRRKQNV